MKKSNISQVVYQNIDEVRVIEGVLWKQYNSMTNELDDTLRELYNEHRRKRKDTEKIEYLEDKAYQLQNGIKEVQKYMDKYEKRLNKMFDEGYEKWLNERATGM